MVSGSTHGRVVSQISLHVPGMSCRHCVRAISAAVSDVAGIQSVAIDLETKTVHVHGTADMDAVRSALATAGYPADG
jgi:copper chaperone